MKCRSLCSLSDEILVELTTNYRQLIPKMQYRVITPYATGPIIEEIRMIHGNFPVDLDAERAAIVREKKKPRAPRKYFIKKDEATTRSTSYEILETPLSSVRLSDSESSLDGSAKTAQSPLTESLNEFFTTSKTTPSQCSSPTTPVWLHADEDMNDAFPDLIGEIKSSESTDKNRSLNDSFRGFSKLSQKQRKKMSSVPVPIMLKENLAKKSNPWGKVSTSSETPLLADIMQAQCSAPKLFERSISMTENPQFSKKVEENTSWGNNVISAVNRPSSYSYGKQSQNLKNVNCFATILLEEKFQADYLAKCQSKPLPLIQMEDQAIEDLIKYYKARDNPDESISVQRVLPQITATPIWKSMAHHS